MPAGHGPCHAKGVNTLRRTLWSLPGGAAITLLQACGGGGGDDAPVAPATPAGGGSATPEATLNCGLPDFQAEALRRINAYRAAGATCGSRGSFPAVGPVAWNAAVATAAYGHSRDMADHNFFDHTGSGGSTLGTRLTAAGYAWSSAGENIAAGQPSVQVVVDGWMASEGHCVNMMSASFVHAGLACARNDASTYRIYWTLDFARPR